MKNEKQNNNNEERFITTFPHINIEISKKIYQKHKFEIENAKKILVKLDYEDFEIKYPEALKEIENSSYKEIEGDLFSSSDSLVHW
jgi:hypothetical protein